MRQNAEERGGDVDAGSSEKRAEFCFRISRGEKETIISCGGNRHGNRFEVALFAVRFGSFMAAIFVLFLGVQLHRLSRTGTHFFRSGITGHIFLLCQQKPVYMR